MADNVNMKMGLGRGLDSLIPQGVEDRGNSSSNEVAINIVDVNPHQPRTVFYEDDLSELSASIKRHGILQPLVVSKKADHFELIAGERRLRAAKMAGLKTVPVIVRDVEEHEKLEIAIIENVHRTDLNPIDEALSYRKLIEEFNYGQEQVADTVGKSRATIANKIRLLSLPAEIKKAIKDERISEGHAKGLLSITNPKEQMALFEKIITDGMNVREVERRIATKGDRKIQGSKEEDLVIRQLADDLKNYLGAKVKVKNTSRGGKIEISYYSTEELARIYQKIKGID